MVERLKDVLNDEAEGSRVSEPEMIDFTLSDSDDERLPSRPVECWMKMDEDAMYRVESPNFEFQVCLTSDILKTMFSRRWFNLDVIRAYSVFIRKQPTRGIAWSYTDVTALGYIY